MAITDERLTLALQYLATTDSEYGELRAEVERSEYMVKTQRSFAFLAADGNNEERKAHADTDPKVLEAQERHVGAISQFEKVRAKRQTEAILIETWRSQESSRRQGQL